MRTASTGPGHLGEMVRGPRRRARLNHQSTPAGRITQQNFTAREPGKEDKKMINTYRIEHIQKATVNGRLVKIFTAYQQHQSGAFVHVGQFSAPAWTANKNLTAYIKI